MKMESYWNQVMEVNPAAVTLLVGECVPTPALHSIIFALPCLAMLTSPSTTLVFILFPTLTCVKKETKTKIW